MDSKQSPGKLFRELLSRPEGVFGFGIDCAICAIAAQMAGSESLYIGGYSAAAIRGWPDMGIMTGPEMLYHTERINDVISNRIQAAIINNVSDVNQSVDIPLIADIDDGYGGVHNISRTTSDFLKLENVAGIHREDQKFPKRCGHIIGKELEDFYESIGKYKLIVKIRDSIDSDKIVIARTDAFSAASDFKDPVTGGDIDEALKRGVAYADVGADLIWCEFPNSDRISMEKFAEGMARHHPDLPLAYNFSASFAWQKDSNPVAFEELNGMGYKYIFSTYPALRGHAYAVYEFAKAFRERKGSALVDFMKMVDGHPCESIMKMMGVHKYVEIEQEYSKGARSRIKKSEGFGLEKK